ncbi:FecR family protein [Dyadobacter frigoris]|uniref:DUF4974 domain-containing protein n=1 Tax=Dyadobacter frigoris TaxID=2576211 RepID=A0A4U6CSQ8_9BACT|nr:FecR domain-containing protein [Dyadobacter frigoris]TKT86561.1 DUF4974 domain-containing protein [Dyadobacter frigoris]
MSFPKVTDQMQREQFLEILKKYRSSSATQDEINLLKAYYNAFEIQANVVDNLSGDEQDKLELEIKEHIDRHLPERSNTIMPLAWRNRQKWLAYAAVALALLVCTVLMKNYQKAHEEVSYVKNSQPVKKANNLVQLPDGSTVILSAGSKIDYPDSFDNRKKREVYLTGEAYFDVRHNPQKPFIVHSGRLSTTVLGTAFNIKAMSGDKRIVITVTRGKVKVSDQNTTFAILIPDQQITYNTLKQEAVQSSVDAQKTVEWKMEDLLFDDVTVFNAARHIEERFHIKIQITDDRLKNQRFTTTFGKDENLESVLKSITEFNDAKYELNLKNKEVIISPK